MDEGMIPHNLQPSWRRGTFYRRGVASRGPGKIRRRLPRADARPIRMASVNQQAVSGEMGINFFTEVVS